MTYERHITCKPNESLCREHKKTVKQHVKCLLVVARDNNDILGY